MEQEDLFVYVLFEALAHVNMMVGDVAAVVRLIQ